MLRIEQALQRLETYELHALGTNLRLWTDPPDSSNERLIELLSSHLRGGIQWERTGDSMPAEARSLLLALAIWASAVAPQSEELFHVVTLLHQEQHGVRIKRDRLQTLLRGLRNLGFVAWIPSGQMRKEQQHTSPTYIGAGPPTIYQLMFYEQEWSRDGWTICLEIAASLFGHYAPHLAGRIIPCAQPRTIRSDGLSALYDITQLMYASKMPGLRLTQKGVLYKRDQTRLHQRFLIQDPLRAPHQHHQIADDTTPLYMQWLLTWSYHSQLIQLDQEYLVPGPEAPHWLGLDPGEQIADGFQLWLSLVAQCKPGIILVMAALLWAPQESWINLSDVIRQLSTWQQSTATQMRLFFPYYTRDQAHMGSALAPLVYLGLLEIGSQKDDAPMLALLHAGDSRYGPNCLARLTQVGRQLLLGHTVTLPQLPKEMPPFVVQSNFEVCVQPLVPPRKHWFLSQIAELTKPDQACIYTITRQSVLRGLRAGWTGDRIMAFLSTSDETTTVVGAGLPQNVVFSIRDWSSGYGRCAVMRIAVVQCESPDLAERILADGLLGDVAIGRVGPTSILIRDDALERAIRLLEKAGLPPPEQPIYVTDPSRASEYGMGLPPTSPQVQPSPRQ